MAQIFLVDESPSFVLEKNSNFYLRQDSKKYLGFNYFPYGEKIIIIIESKIKNAALPPVFLDRRAYAVPLRVCEDRGYL
jgi:hypothetical protein